MFSKILPWCWVFDRLNPVTSNCTAQWKEYGIEFSITLCIILSPTLSLEIFPGQQSLGMLVPMAPACVVLQKQKCSEEPTLEWMLFTKSWCASCIVWLIAGFSGWMSIYFDAWLLERLSCRSVMVLLKQWQWSSRDPWIWNPWSTSCCRTCKTEIIFF